MVVLGEGQFLMSEVPLHSSHGGRKRHRTWSHLRYREDLVTVWKNMVSVEVSERETLIDTNTAAMYSSPLRLGESLYIEGMQ